MTLEILARLGVGFVVLAPHQARRVRPLAGGQWRDATEATLDTTVAYTVSLPSHQSIQVFFYNGPLSRAIAFEGLASDGEQLATRLLNAFAAGRPEAQLVHVATDGETFGHHVRHGDLALAQALDRIEASGSATLTNYGEFLEKVGATHEVEIANGTSWSCVHGIERWRTDCGCTTGGHEGWKQAWRAPQRAGFDALRDALSIRFEARAGDLLRAPWEARDDYIELILDRSGAAVEHFFKRHAARPLSRRELTTALKLLELQRMAILMYTSCGWFFDDLARIEPIQCLAYAGRAAELGRELFGDGHEAALLAQLRQAQSNDLTEGSGADIYDRHVRPLRTGPARVAAHIAMKTLLEGSASPVGDLGCWRVEASERRVIEHDAARLAVGRLEVKSTLTHDQASYVFAVLRNGIEIEGGAKSLMSDAAYRAIIDPIAAAVEKGELDAASRLIRRHLAESPVTRASLIGDEGRRLAELLPCKS